MAQQLTQVADSAFVSAVHWGVIVAAMATAVGVVVALLFLPARPRPEDREEQDSQYAQEHTGEFEMPVGRVTEFPGAGAAGPVPEPAPEG